jgi:hypothetical protein
MISNVSFNNQIKLYDGVAVSLFLHTPTWFQRRYTVMVRNIRANLPSNWAIQIFYTGKGQSLNGININKGLQRMIENKEIIVTFLPENIGKLKRKQYEVWTERWIWENMVADHVLTFGGNAVLCGNSPRVITDFIHFDYIGAPWNFKKGVGGDGGISLRNRKTIVSVIDYELSKTDILSRDTAYKSWGQEDIFFVSRMMEMNQLLNKSYRLATRNDTLQFAAIESYANQEVLGASGILAGLSNEDRDKFITYCPEIKMLYPSLHDPNCFGASPNSELCSKSICALRNKTQRKGGC